MRFKVAALVLGISSVLSGCKEEASTKVPGLDRIISVEEFSSNAQFRQRVLQECTNQESSLKDDGNCVNAKKSLRVSASGSGTFPSLNTASDVNKPKK